MTDSETSDRSMSPAPAAKVAEYAPPAVSWEEDFEPLAQGSEGNPGCETGGTCP